jgi:branched-chain amino acid transport system permease protein
MLGAYACVLASNAGLRLWAAFIVAALLVGLFGVVVERLIIRFLYGRIIDTLLATWGLSLFLVGAVTTLFGPQGRSVSTSFGNITVGGTNISSYNLVLIAIAVAVLAATWALARFTTFGLLVRGTMQDPTVASALGVNRGLIYMATFGYGSALAGLAGAVLAPITGAAPTMGVFFVAKAFITVIAGGHLPLLGTMGAAGLFGAIDGVVSYVRSSVAGEVSVLVVAIVLLRLLPLGLTGRLRTGL